MFCLLFFPFLSRSAEPLNDLLSGNVFLSSHWGAEQGLPTNDMRAVVQTHDGYIWIGSAAGLLRFDGVNHKRFDRGSMPLFPGNEVISLLEDNDGVLWVGFVRGGVLTYADGVFSPRASCSPLIGENVYGMFLDGEGAVCLCSSAGVFRVKGERAGFVEGVEGEPHTGAPATNGGFYLAGSTLIYCKSWRALSTIKVQPQGGAFTAVQQYGDSVVIVGGNAGADLLRIRPDGTAQRQPVAAIGRVLTIVPFGPDRFLLGTLDHGAMLLTRDRVTVPTGFEALHGGARRVRGISLDREGGIWAATPGGLYRFRKSFIRIFGKDDGITSETAWTLHYTHSHDLWVGGGDQETYRLSDGTSRVYTTSDGMPSSNVSAMFEDRQGSMWFGGIEGGLTVFRNGRLTPVRNFPDKSVLSLMEDHGGTLWVGAAHGLWRLQGDTFVHFPQRPTSDSVSKVRSINEDSNGDLWLIASSLVMRFRNTALTMFRASLDNAPLLSMCLYVDSGRVWVGTYGGGLFLIRGDSIKAVHPSGVELGPRVLAIHEDAAGYLWINAEHDLQRVAKSDLLRAAEDPGHSVRVWVYDHNEGLSNLEFNLSSSGSSQQLPSGEILYASTNGVVVVNTNFRPAEESPLQPLIEDLFADGVPVDIHRVIRLPAGTQRLELRYTALAYNVPARVQFRLKLVGLDHEWLERDGLTRSVFYAHPSAGTYTFVVQATTGTWPQNPQQAALSFEIAPYLYDTWWMRASVAVLIVSLLLLVYTLRIRSVHKMNTALRVEIDQRREFESALRESRERYRLLFETANDAIFVLEGDSFVECNETAAALFGYSRAVMSGLKPYDISPEIQPDGRPSSDAGQARIKAAYAGEPQFFEWQHRRADGSLFLTEVSLNRLSLEDKLVLLAIVRDITERKKTEDQVRASLDEKTVLLKEIHHRVKNNMQVISSLLNLQAGAGSDVNLQRALRESQQRIRSMALIHEMLYRSGNLAHIAFRDYVEVLSGQVVRSFGMHYINVRVMGDNTMLTIDQAIPAALMVNELVTNAMRHAFVGRETGDITIRIADLPDSVAEFSVSDNGVGLPANFDPAKGDTLGMQLVATLAHQLSGELFVSRDGGTEIRIRFART
jgi:PAS domain S-box-containing protein